MVGMQKRAADFFRGEPRPVFSLSEEGADLGDDAIDRLIRKLRVDGQAQNLRRGALGHAETRWTAGEPTAIGRLAMNWDRIVDPGTNPTGPQPIA